MNIRFENSEFVIVGILASTVPILIHLWYRRRFRVVHWAAMEFLLAAVQRKKKGLRVRDILLLTLRILVVVLLGLFFSKPWIEGSAPALPMRMALILVVGVIGLGFCVAWTLMNPPRRWMIAVGVSIEAFMGLSLLLTIMNSPVVDRTDGVSPNTPVHALLVVDNSRSMGVNYAGKTFLDRAKWKAIEVIDQLPAGSDITVIPLAGSQAEVMPAVFRSKDDARRAVNRLILVDTVGDIPAGIQATQRAMQRIADRPLKRVVFFTDVQANSWDKVNAKHFQQLNSPVVVYVTSGPVNNIWVSELRQDEGLSSTGVATRFLARIHSQVIDPAMDSSRELRSFDVRIVLLVDGAQAATQIVTLIPGQVRDIEFTHHFDVLPESVPSTNAVVTVIVQTDQDGLDQLPSDNLQQIAVPIVSSIPIVFVDQYGDDENLDQNKIGETYALRHLMAPRIRRDSAPHQLFRIEHLRVEQLTRASLKQARLVVVAGVEKPGAAMVSLLRDYVFQGGPLVILAGSAFDPAAWMQQAWLSGQGILPAPLEEVPYGHALDESIPEVAPFFVSFDSLQHEFFRIEGEDQSSLAALFQATPFFKSVKVSLTERSLADLQKSETKKLEELSEIFRWKTTQASDDTFSKRNQEDAEQKNLALEPDWWKWRSPLPLVDFTIQPEVMAKNNLPQVLASYESNGFPFIVERRVGAGRIVLFTSGVSSNWNLLRSSGAMYLFHRAFSQMIGRTFPQRNFQAGEKIILPVEKSSQEPRFSLVLPNGVVGPLEIDSRTAFSDCVSVPRPLIAGVYQIFAENADDSTPNSTDAPHEASRFCVVGAESESDLTCLKCRELSRQVGSDTITVFADHETVRFAGDDRQGYQIFDLLGWCLLGCLILEQLIIMAGELWKTRSSSLMQKHEIDENRVEGAE